MPDRTNTAEYRRALELARGDAEKLRAIAEQLHRSESLHMHDDVSDLEPCRYCWLRAGQAMHAVRPSSAAEAVLRAFVRAQRLGWRTITVRRLSRVAAGDNRALPPEPPASSRDGEQDCDETPEGA